MQPQVIEPAVMESLATAEINQAIATAKQYPRNVAKSIDRAVQLATMTPEIAEECHFSLPPRGGKDIEGPSVRLAEILIHAWGNLRAGSRVLEEGERQVTVQGMCHDLETNTCIQKEVRRRIVDRNGQRYSDDMILMTCNAASSIAFRNAVFASIPKALWKMVESAALKASEQTPLPDRRTRALEWFQARKIPQKKLFHVLGVSNKKEITDVHLKKLRGLINASREGALNLDEYFKGRPDELPNAVELEKETSELDEALTDPGEDIDADLSEEYGEIAVDANVANSTFQQFERGYREAMRTEDIDLVDSGLTDSVRKLMTVDHINALECMSQEKREALRVEPPRASERR